MLLLNIGCGAAVLGPNLKGLVLPRCAQRIHIAADNDETGRGAANCAARIWRNLGLRVRVSVPEIEGEDFNDVWRRREGNQTMNMHEGFKTTGDAPAVEPQGKPRYQLYHTMLIRVIII